MKQLLSEVLHRREDYTLVFFNETPIYVANSLIPLHYRFSKLFLEPEVYSLLVLDHISDQCNLLEIVKGLDVVICYVDEVNDLPYVNPITSKNLAKVGYLNLSSTDLEKLLASYLPNVTFTCNMVKTQNTASKHVAKITNGTIDFGQLPADRSLFIFLKATVAAIILAGELDGRDQLEIDLENLDELLQTEGSGYILRTFYPSGNLLFNLKINLEQGKVGSLISQVSKIPDKAIPYFLQGA